MTASVVVFPTVATPDGWTREVKGPRVWLVPPTPGGRIVIAPLQARSGMSSEQFLHQVLLQERGRFAQLKQGEPAFVPTKAGVRCTVIDIAGGDDQPIEWRCYALFTTPIAFGLMFLQVLPARHAELRDVFLAILGDVVVPDADPPPQIAMAPWDEL